MTLRPLTLGDLGWVLHRHATLYAAEFGWDATFEELCAGSSPSTPTLRDAHPGPHRRLDRRGGRRAGRIGLLRARQRTTARLRLLLVEPWARGLGLGAPLVGQCLHFAREAGYADIVLLTYDQLAAARKVYQAAGFTLASEYPDDAFGHRMMSQTWSRPLETDRSNLPSGGSL